MKDAVVAAAWKLKKFRKPAIQETQPVSVQLFLTVFFEIKKSGKGVVSVSPYVITRFPLFSRQR
jgi:hypothetical protein